MRVNEKGWLESEEGDQPLVCVPSVRGTKLAMKRPKAVIWHWTATVSETPLEISERIKDYAGEKDSAESWHVLIGRDGTVYQSVSLLMASWHVKRGGIIGPNYYQNLNKATVSIVLENAGRLRLVDGSWYVQPPWRKTKPKKDVLGEPVADDLVAAHGHNSYMTYTAAQGVAAIRVLAAISIQYEMPRKYCAFSHSSFEYPREEDPGPLWMDGKMPSILDKVFGVPVDLSKG